MRRQLKSLLWFLGLWLAGVVALGLAAMILRGALGLAGG
jgi:hypothetical protein